jgi:hypothetical protein
MRRLFFTLLWGAVFFFASVTLQCVVFADYFRVPSQSGGTVFQWRTSWKYLHMAVGGMGLLIGVAGLLPGTRRRKSN